ncbi:MAG: isoprenyl transferase [Candidatus Omnitrophica bacterium]|nr:isoprenyl transferase [Candidatus Omnitrophota bacterium]MCM8826722.1 isoprenyl transferase [Candidatus Omnitrophota bacterium]
MNVPYHIAIIMDGNGRWAKQRGLSRSVGHRKGLERIKEVTEEAKKLGVKILTLFAFSTENWSRPKREIENIFSYLEKFLDKNTDRLLKEGIKLNFIGRKDRINKNLLKKIEKTQLITVKNNELIVNVALDYGGRWDIVEATKKITKELLEGKLHREDMDEGFFSKYLSLGALPDVDLLIRTSGELRISNFLLWNLAYSELYFTKVFWPDFDKNEFRKAILEYSKRKRRFGGV